MLLELHLLNRECYQVSKGKITRLLQIGECTRLPEVQKENPNTLSIVQQPDNDIGFYLFPFNESWLSGADMGLRWPEEGMLI
jgi:hypothetical protein